MAKSVSKPAASKKTAPPVKKKVEKKDDKKSVPTRTKPQVKKPVKIEKKNAIVAKKAVKTEKKPDKIVKKAEKVEKKVVKVEKKGVKVEKKAVKVEKKDVKVEKKAVKIEKKDVRVEKKPEKVEKKVEKVGKKIEKVEHKVGKAEKKIVPVEKKVEKKETEKPVKEGKEPKPKARPEASDDKGEVTIEKKLIALYSLQQIDSQIDKIRIIRGELPLEVQDLEDEIAGLETRVGNYIQECDSLEKSVVDKKAAIKDSQALIKKYEDQQMNVRNNREYDSLSKEIEFQNLEIQLSEKRIREYQVAVELKKEEIERYQKTLEDRKNDLDIKKSELDDIIAETEKEKTELMEESERNRKLIEERLLTAYTRIRKNARNGLAVVQIERDACGGCFNKIPPQHQLDIRMHKKIIVCEYCGRILVDDGIVHVVHKK
jgi:uncharacterized protein